MKGNKVLDFVFTLLVLHLIFSSLFDELCNLNWRWIIINGVWLLITTLIGEYICIRLEQREVRFLEKLFKTPQ